MRLADCFTPALTFVLDVVRKPQSFPEYEAARAKVEELLNSSGRMAKTLGVAASEFQDARFAVCAWMDEVVLGSQWEGKSLWLHQPLQRAVYGTVNAGDEYFDRLEALLAKMDKDFNFSVPGEKSTVEELSFGDEEAREEDGCDPPENQAPFTAPPSEDGTGIGLKGVLEVFGLTLMLGFTGKYFHPDDQAVLRSLRQKVVTAALGSVAKYGRDPAARLFPGLYGLDGADARRRRRFWRGMDWVDMMVLGVPVLAVAVLFFAYSFLLSGALRGFMGGP